MKRSIVRAINMWPALMIIPHLYRMSPEYGSEAYSFAEMNQNAFSKWNAYSLNSPKKVTEP